MSMPPKVLMICGPGCVFSMLFISQYRGPLSSAVAAPFSVAMTWASSTDHSSAGQSLSGKLL
jgi:hypothetical protein